VPTDLVRAICLGLIQGLTEFLPVSSSGHLVVVPALLHWPTPCLSFDTTLHAGTGVAVLLFYRREWVRLLTGGWRALRQRTLGDNPDGRLLLLLAIATVPAAVAGVAFKGFFERLFGEPSIAALMLVVTGVILIGAEQLARRRVDQREVEPGIAVGVGVAQAVAIIPGISRSGATIAAGMAAGLSREAATQFSFLLAGPITVGVGLLAFIKLLSAPAALAGSASAICFPAGHEVMMLVAGFVTAFLVGYCVIGWLLGYVRRATLYPFATYCLIAGVSIWWLLR